MRPILSALAPFAPLAAMLAAMPVPLATPAVAQMPDNPLTFVQAGKWPEAAAAAPNDPVAGWPQAGGETITSRTNRWSRRRKADLAVVSLVEARYPGFVLNPVR